MTILPFPQPELSHFDEWWSLQFHKTGKVMAKAKWDRITSPEGLTTRAMDKSTNEYVQIHLQASPQEIVDAQKRQNKALFDAYGFSGPALMEAKKYLRRPVQWLNQGGFWDE